MERNWKLIQEILEFLTLSEECKVENVGSRECNGNIVLIKDEYYLTYEKLMHKSYYASIEDTKQAKEKSTSIYWKAELVNYHINLLTEIKAIKVIVEDVKEEICRKKWDDLEYDYHEYNEFLYEPLEDYYPSYGVYKDVEFYQLTWLGIEMLDVLTKMEDDGEDLMTLDTPHPTIVKYINPLIAKENNTTEDKINVSIEKINLSTRAYNCLKRNGIHTVYDVLKNQMKLMELKNIGQKVAEEINTKLWQYLN